VDERYLRMGERGVPEESLLWEELGGLN